MSEPQPRSSCLMSRQDTVLLVIDIQERLLPLIPARGTIVWNTGRLIDGARVLGLPVLATEQYPQGLGPTVGELRARLEHCEEKRMFSCRECAAPLETLRNRGVTNALLCGIESHVCVQQTALDLLAGGWSVFVAADATGSRHAIDHETALRRMETSGATLTTTESALFEWCETSAAAGFKAISALVRQTMPGAGG